MAVDSLLHCNKTTRQLELNFSRDDCPPLRHDPSFRLCVFLARY